MNRRSSLASLLAMVVAIIATLLPAQRAAAQDNGAIVGVVSVGRAGPVADAHVVLSNADGPIARTASNAQGIFEFRNLPAGRYHLVASKDGVGTGQADAALRAGQIIRVPIYLVNNTPGALAGVVLTADGPVADATVVVSNRAGEVARGTTGAEGRFGFRNLAPGAYLVTAGKDGVGRGQARVEIRAGEVTNVRILLAGRQVQFGGVGGVVSNADGPVADALVTISGPRFSAQTRTNADGVYLFQNLRPGHYLITAEKRGVGAGRAEGDVVAGTVIRVPITLVAPPQGGTLNGHVGANGAIVAGANVVVMFNGQPVAQMLSDRTGAFSFAHLRPGHYVVQAAKRGVGQGRVEADVTEGGTTTVRVILQ